MAKRGHADLQASEKSTSRAGSKVPSAFGLWFEDAWSGWLRHLAAILVLGLGVVLYKFNLLNERLAGLLLALGISIGALVLALLGARPYLKTGGQRLALGLLALIWACAGAYPIVHGIFPGAPLGSGAFADEGAQITLDVPAGGTELYLLGRLRGGGGAVHAGYKISAHWQGGQKTVAGELDRNVLYGRVGRRGTSSSTTEHTEEKHYLGRTSGPIVLTLDEKDGAIDKPVSISLHSLAVPPIALIVLAGAVVAAAIALDRMLDAKGRTSLGVSAAISLVFALYYGLDQVRPGRVVAPAVGSFFIAVVAGGLGAWIVSWLIRKISPEKKRRARV